jgi:hypothetical protein
MAKKAAATSTVGLDKEHTLDISETHRDLYPFTYMAKT